ncbi:MAG: acyl-CoA/acyl-ACP dehydrogenase, partial [Gammaproteobacteria bacterium]|nr:acyl-CoA/acyl-ACP dehydrogenase [Gammaproteobacteria bacterium]
MNFDFSDDEKLVRDQTARMLSDRSPTSAVRRVLEGEAVYSEDVWAGLKEMGLTATAIPEAYGGVAAGYPTLCLVAEQLGAHVAATPFSSSVYLATEALLAFGSEAQKEKCLPGLAAGDAVGTLAVVESGNELTQESIELQASSGQLSGTKLVVPDGNIADLCIVLARDIDAGLSMYLVDLSGDGVTRQAVETVDPTRDSASLTFADCTGELLGVAGEGWQQLQRLYDRAAVLFAFEQLGGAKSALDMAVGYAQ